MPVFIPKQILIKSLRSLIAVIHLFLGIFCFSLLSSPIKMELQCGTCNVQYDASRNCPKCLPCGHTICKECVQNTSLGGTCPNCGKPFSVNPSDHPDNMFVIQMVEREGPPLHKKIKTEDGKLQQLQRGVDAGRKLVLQLRLVVLTAAEALTRLHDTTAAQLRQMEEALEQMLRERDGVIDISDETTEPPEPQLQLAVQLAVKLEECLRVLSSHKCSLLAEEEGGATWRATLELAPADHILHLVLLQLRVNDELERVGDDDAAPCHSRRAAEDLGHAPRTDHVAHYPPQAHPAPCAHFVGPPGTSILTIYDDDVDEDKLKVNGIIRDVRRWKDARFVMNVKGTHSEKLLRVMASQLEEVRFNLASEVEPSVMQEVLTMTSLRRLNVACIRDAEGYPDLPLQLEELEIWNPTENQLRCVQRMPRLRSLVVSNYYDPEVTFPPARRGGGLVWLGVILNGYHQTTMLSLIRAHASSLQELHVYCAPEDDNVPGGFYFPDLGESLVASGLVSLRRLVLERPGGDCAATHACLLQRRALRDLLPPTVDVSCRACEVPLA